MSVTAAGSVSQGGAQSLPLVTRVLPHALVVGLAAASFIVYCVLLADLEPPVSGFSIPWWSLILVFFVTEAFPVHVHFGTEAHSLSLGELALIVGLYLAAPDELIVAQLLGAAVALLIVRQQRLLTASYNLAVFTLGTCLALLCFHGFLLFGEAYGPAGWAGAIFGAAAYAGAGLVLVTLRARMVSGRPLTAQPRMLAAAAAGGCLASASLAVCAMQLAQHDVRSLWVMIVPVTATAIALTT